jgi:hypothetical protein
MGRTCVAIAATIVRLISRSNPHTPESPGSPDFTQNLQRHPLAAIEDTGALLRSARQCFQ